MKNGILSDEEFHALCVEIAGRFDGLSIAQVDHILQTVGRIAHAGATFSVEHPAYKQPAAELLAACGAAGNTRQ